MKTENQKVLFYVQHLLGIGHVARASRLCKALQQGGLNVTVAFGGPKVDGFDWGGAELFHLPAITSGNQGFSDLVDENSATIDEQFKKNRRNILLDLFDTQQPDILLLEAYPFARRNMRFELLPLLEHADKQRNRPIIVSSVRDILQEGKKPERRKEVSNIIQQYFNAVLVHGDENFAPFSITFPECNTFSHKLYHTGLIAPEYTQQTGNGDIFDIIVSAGGGAVGKTVFNAAIEAINNGVAADKQWLILTGPNLSQVDLEQITKDIPDYVKIERFRSDFPALLTRAELSISQAGYNTMVDVFQAKCPAIVIPFAAGGETEQTRRAQIMKQNELAEYLTEDEISGETLAILIERILRSSADKLDTIYPDLNGAKSSAQILKTLLNK